VWDINGNISFNWKRLIAYKICKLLLRVQTRGIIHLIGVYKKILASAKVKMCEGERKVFNAHTVELTTPDGEVKQFSG
jgi:hypothetical protein